MILKEYKWIKWCYGKTHLITIVSTVTEILRNASISLWPIVKSVFVVVIRFWKHQKGKMSFHFTLYYDSSIFLLVLSFISLSIMFSRSIRNTKMCFPKKMNLLMNLSFFQRIKQDECQFLEHKRNYEINRSIVCTHHMPTWFHYCTKN